MSSRQRRRSGGDEETPNSGGRGVAVVRLTLGLLPRMLPLARGTEPPEDIRILRIVPGLR